MPKSINHGSEISYRVESKHSVSALISIDCGGAREIFHIRHLFPSFYLACSPSCLLSSVAFSFCCPFSSQHSELYYSRCSLDRSSPGRHQYPASRHSALALRAPYSLLCAARVSEKYILVLLSYLNLLLFRPEFICQSRCRIQQRKGQAPQRNALFLR